MPQTRNFKRAIDPGSAAIGWRQPIPVRMVVEDEQGKGLATELLDQQGAQVVKITGTQQGGQVPVCRLKGCSEGLASARIGPEAKLRAELTKRSDDGLFGPGLTWRRFGAPVQIQDAKTG